MDKELRYGWSGLVGRDDIEVVCFDSILGDSVRKLVSVEDAGLWLSGPDASSTEFIPFGRVSGVRIRSVRALQKFHTQEVGEGVEASRTFFEGQPGAGMLDADHGRSEVPSNELALRRDSDFFPHKLFPRQVFHFLSPLALASVVVVGLALRRRRHFFQEAQADG